MKHRLNLPFQTIHGWYVSSMQDDFYLRKDWTVKRKEWYETFNNLWLDTYEQAFQAREAYLSEWTRPTHEEEYVGIDRYTEEKEEQAFAELDKKLQQDQLKFDQGKPRYSLVPSKALEGVAKVLTFGANKYSANSWRKIEDTDRYMDALIRHIEAVRQGELYDSDSGLQHMAHVATNAMFLFEFIEKDIT